MKWSYQIGSIRGIPIQLHLTFLVILVFFIWAFAVQDIKIEGYGIIIGFGEMNAPEVVKYLFSITTSVLFLSRLPCESCCKHPFKSRVYECLL